MRVYTYSEARQNLALLLEQAEKEGEIRIKRKDGRIYTIKPYPLSASPLDVDGIDIDVNTAEIVALIREGRARFDQDRAALTED